MTKQTPIVYMMFSIKLKLIISFLKMILKLMRKSFSLKATIKKNYSQF